MGLEETYGKEEDHVFVSFKEHDFPHFVEEGEIAHNSSETSQEPIGREHL